MEDRELYERKRMHDLVNDLYSAVGRIELLFERDQAIQAEITRINQELSQAIKAINRLATEQAAVNSSVQQLNKFFWLMVAIALTGGAAINLI